MLKFDLNEDYSRYADSLTWKKAYCFAVAGRCGLFAEQWQRDGWTVCFHRTGRCAKGQFIIVQWIWDGRIGFACADDGRSSLCQIIRWCRNQFECCALWRCEINAHLRQCFQFVLRDYYLRFVARNWINIFVLRRCVRWIHTSSPSFDVCITISKLSTSNWVFISPNNWGTVFDGRTINVIFLTVASGIKFEMMHCTLPSSPQTISIKRRTEFRKKHKLNGSQSTWISTIDALLRHQIKLSNFYFGHSKIFTARMLHSIRLRSQFKYTTFAAAHYSTQRIGCLVGS